jgi:hypothetical protein
MTRSYVAVSRIMAVLHLVCFWMAGKGWAASGTADQPIYSGMVVSYVGLVALFWCWHASIRVVRQRVSRRWVRVALLSCCAVMGWLVGPFVVLLLARAKTGNGVDSPSVTS